MNDSKVTIQGTEATEFTCEEYNANIGMEYDWDDDKKCYINNNGKYTAT